MTEHVHEWEFYVRFDGTGAGTRCGYPLCNKELSRHEVKRRLNATEYLKEDKARDLGLAVGNALEALHHGDYGDADGYLSHIYGWAEHYAEKLSDA